MSDEQDHKLEAKSDYVADASSVSTPDIDAVPEAELPDQELYHSHSWWTTYVFSQDAKYIGIQYALTAIGTGLLGLVLSWLMRIQLAFPGLGWLEPSSYYQFVTMHGMIMVVYLLTALFLGGFGNLLIPLMCGARDMAFPYVNMLSYWAFVVAVVVLLASFFVPWRSHRSRLDVISSTSNYSWNTWLQWGNNINVNFTHIICGWFHNGWIKLYNYSFTIKS